MPKSKKVNPNRKPKTAIQAYAEGKLAGTQGACAMMLVTLFNKGFVAPEKAAELWRAFEDHADAVKQGYVNITDDLITLRDEYNIIV